MSVDQQVEAGRRDILDRVVRYRDLIPCRNAFIDTRTPGSEAKENFTIIGPGVSENPDQHIHIAEPHGFNIGGARQPPNCVNSQHSHDTAETFLVHSGHWRFDFGEHGEDAQVLAGPGDLVSFPTHAFRGFTNVGDDVGFLFAVLGGDDPGRVLWAPKVFDMARDYGLILMENGSLVDTAAGQTPPPGLAPMPRTSQAQVEALRRITQAEAARLRVAADLTGPSDAGLGRFAGVTETPLIGDESPAEHLGAGHFPWRHGFAVRRLDLDPGAQVPSHRRATPEVVFVDSGHLTVRIDDEAVTLDAGDTLTVPVGALRAYASEAGARVFAVHGGDRPPPPEFTSH